MILLVVTVRHGIPSGIDTIKSQLCFWPSMMNSTSVLFSFGGVFTGQMYIFDPAAGACVSSRSFARQELGAQIAH